MAKRYKVVNFMYLDGDEEENVYVTSLSDEYSQILDKGDEDIWIDANPLIGKPRYFELTLAQIQNYCYSKENIDLFCKANPECYGKTFITNNMDYYDESKRDQWRSMPMHVEYRPIQFIPASDTPSSFEFTVGQLLDYIEKNNISRDGKVYLQRVEDRYFTPDSGWLNNSVKKEGDFGPTMYYPTFSPALWDNDNLYLDAHY